MKTTPHAAPARARSLAPIAPLLIVAAIAHALLVGCGGGAQNQDNTSSTPPGTTAPPTGSSSDTGATVAGSTELGAKVYKERCVLCHGPEGKGDGAAAATLNPKPRNHTDGAYMNSRTDVDLLEVIRNGKGSMPPWGKVLSEAEIQAVLGYVRSLAK